MVCSTTAAVGCVGLLNGHTSEVDVRAHVVLGWGCHSFGKGGQMPMMGCGVDGVFIHCTSRTHLPTGRTLFTQLTTTIVGHSLTRCTHTHSLTHAHPTTLSHACHSYLQMTGTHLALVLTALAGVRVFAEGAAPSVGGALDPLSETPLFLHPSLESLARRWRRGHAHATHAPCCSRKDCLHDMAM